MSSGRKPDGDAALSNAERQARYRLRHQVGQPAVVCPDPLTGAAAHSAGALRSTNCSRCKASMPPGSKHCLTRFRARRRPMPYRPSLILISTRSPRLRRHADTAATDDKGLAGRTACSFCWARTTASRAALRAPAGAGFGP
jgi:hypothetical protein